MGTQGSKIQTRDYNRLVENKRINKKITKKYKKEDSLGESNFGYNISINGRKTPDFVGEENRPPNNLKNCYTEKKASVKELNTLKIHNQNDSNIFTFSDLYSNKILKSAPQTCKLVTFGNSISSEKKNSNVDEEESSEEIKISNFAFGNQLKKVIRHRKRERKFGGINLLKLMDN